MLANKLLGASKAAVAATYIEDVFSTYLYTGNGAVQTIPNGIALGSAYGGSVYFDGTGDYLSVPSNSALELLGGSFTIELWFYMTAAQGNYGLISKYANGSGSGYILRLDTTYIRFFTTAATADRTYTFNQNTWYHVAVVSNGTTGTLYVNGVAQGATFSTNGTQNTADTTQIGRTHTTTNDFPGYISNLRVVKGTAVYTSNFTPPTSPLTAITNTSLLTCQSPSATTDYSSNAFTITVTNAIAQNGGGPFTDSTANKGGLVWLKGRSGATDHALYDTARGATFDLVSNSTAAQTTQSTGLTTFNSNGFSLGALAKLNTNAATYASWTFRKQAKFFDVVTYTGNGAATRAIPHNLNSTPGFVIIKETSSTDNWTCWHRSFASFSTYILLNTTGASTTTGGSTIFKGMSSTDFTIGSDTGVNANGSTYVAYLFAHDAGGFGAAGTDNVISCGSYTGNGSATGPTITLGYEPQWLLVKRSSVSGDSWILIDNMRGFVVGDSDARLYANFSDAETTATLITPTATGFQLNSASSSVNASGSTYIYIAIRRPMKTPTSGTSVYYAELVSQANTIQTTSVPFPGDLYLTYSRNGTDGSNYRNTTSDRLRGLGTPSDTFTSSGLTNDLMSNSTSAQVTRFIQLRADSRNLTRGDGWNSATYGNQLFQVFRRAPGFFDVVCYTGTGANRTVTHNLGVVPELMIVKLRSGVFEWQVYSSGIANTEYLMLDSANAKATGATRWNSTTPTSSVFSLGTSGGVNSNGSTYVAYLFATLAGVSKVGSYTGTGTTQTINCGFTAGSRFVMIKRTDSAGDWYVWDTARGIVSGNDPYLLLNSTSAEVTNTDYIDPANSGFEISSTAPAAINANGGTFIFLAIA
jgi:hypothetical protein